MKLNLILDTPEEISKVISPVGWWKVTTEGDVEGRFTQNMGTYYGHVAEIAFSIPQNAGYVYTFERDNKLLCCGTNPVSIVKRKTANISIPELFGIESRDFLLKNVQQWLDSEDVSVVGTKYYAGYEIKLNL